MMIIVPETVIKSPLPNTISLEKVLSALIVTIEFTIINIMIAHPTIGG
jgi:hypothetical protein